MSSSESTARPSAAGTRITIDITSTDDAEVIKAIGAACRRLKRGEMFGMADTFAFSTRRLDAANTPVTDLPVYPELDAVARTMTGRIVTAVNNEVKHVETGAPLAAACVLDRLIEYLTAIADDQ